MSQASEKYVSVKEDFLSKPLYPLEEVSLMGSKCHKCGEVFLGRAVACQNCQSEDMESLNLSRTGKLYSYTIDWNRPPGDYKGPDPYEPFAVGLVELPDGIRILSVLADCDLDKLEIDMDLELSVEELYKDEEGNTIVTYKFRPQEAGRR